MKKLSLLLSAIAFVLTIGLQSCGGGAGTNTPGNAVKKSFNLLADKKFDKVVEMYVKKDGSAFTDEERAKISGLMNMASVDLEKKKGIKSLEITEEKISDDGKTANVKWKVVYGNEETDTEDGELMNINGEWKLVIGN